MSMGSSERGLTRADPGAPFEFSDEQRRIIRDSYANGASDEEFAVLMEIARARRLNPLLRQIHFVHRWDSEKSRHVWSAQVSIDGLRAIAERTGRYAGQDEPEFVENPDGTLKLCKVRVWRSDWPRPAVGIAYWNEYVQSIRDRQTGRQRPVALWGRMPRTMLAKCAEALALRKAFPEDVGGLYTPDEMGQAQSDAPQLSAVPPPKAQVVHARPVPVPPPAKALPRESAKETSASSAAPPSAPSTGGAAGAQTASEGGSTLRVIPAGESSIPVEVVQAERVPRAPRDPWMDFYG